MIGTAKDGEAAAEKSHEDVKVFIKTQLAVRLGSSHDRDGALFAPPPAAHAGPRPGAEHCGLPVVCPLSGDSNPVY